MRNDPSSFCGRPASSVMHGRVTLLFEDHLTAALQPRLGAFVCSSYSLSLNVVRVSICRPLFVFLSGWDLHEYGNDRS